MQRLDFFADLTIVFCQLFCFRELSNLLLFQLVLLLNTLDTTTLKNLLADFKKQTNIESYYLAAYPLFFKVLLRCFILTICSQIVVRKTKTHCT